MELADLELDIELELADLDFEPRDDPKSRDLKNSDRLEDLGLERSDEPAVLEVIQSDELADLDLKRSEPRAAELTVSLSTQGTVTFAVSWEAAGGQADESPMGTLTVRANRGAIEAQSRRNQGVI